MANYSRRYTELAQLKTFEERFEYLKTNSNIGIQTFAGSRYLNQYLYNNVPEWDEAREKVIIRDNGCDLGIPDRPLAKQRIIVHHINPITKEQVLNRDPCLFDPENLISCSFKTHNAIHYSNACPESRDPIERTKNDTCPWKRSAV